MFWRMKTWLPFLILTLRYCSCQQVQKEKWTKSVTDSSVVIADTLRSPDISVLRENLFVYFTNHRSESFFDTTDETFQKWGGPANFPPYTVQAGELFAKGQIHAMIFYSDEAGAGLFIYKKQVDNWIKIFEDTSDVLSAGNSSPLIKDWNFDGVKDLCLYYQPALSMSVIGNYALWLMAPEGSKLTYVKGFSEIENPETDSLSNTIIGSYYYHGARKSEWKFVGNRIKKISASWEKED